MLYLSVYCVYAYLIIYSPYIFKTLWDNLLWIALLEERGWTKWFFLSDLQNFGMGWWCHMCSFREAKLYQTGMLEKDLKGKKKKPSLKDEGNKSKGNWFLAIMLSMVLSSSVTFRISLKTCHFTLHVLLAESFWK